jgi:hypothetical protein
VGRCIVGYSDVLPLNIVSSESFTRHEMPALLATHFVDYHMERALNSGDIYVFGGGSPRAVDGDIQVCYIDCFLYGWLLDK